MRKTQAEWERVTARRPAGGCSEGRWTDLVKATVATRGD
jgi:hypothetical protein